MQIDYSYKIIIVGDTNVGKTSILNKINNIDNKNVTTTIGVDFLIKRIIFDDNIIAKLKIWDTAGHERFNTITSHYYRNINGIILCFDLSKKETFINLEKWFNEIKKYNNNKNIPIIVIGNKNDLNKNLDLEEINNFCKKINGEYLSISSYNDSSDYLFRNIISNIANKIRNVNFESREYKIKEINLDNNYRNYYCCFY